MKVEPVTCGAPAGRVTVDPHLDPTEARAPGSRIGITNASTLSLLVKTCAIDEQWETQDEDVVSIP